MSTLESTRVILEEIECFESAIVDELESVARRSHRSKLAQEIRIRNLLVASQERAKKLLKLNNNNNNNAEPQGGIQKFYERKEHLQETLQQGEENNMWEFVEDDPSYLAKIVSFGGEIQFENEEEERSVWRPSNRLERRSARAKIDDFVLSHQNFTGEEYYGRFLDLHELFLIFQNLHSSLRRVTYLDYLRTKLLQIPPNGIELDQKYVSYIEKLKLYLLEFERRARPLTILENNNNSSDLLLPFEKEIQSSKDENELIKVLSLSQLKEALEARGLKASGTALQRANRLCIIKNLPEGEPYPEELLSKTGPSNFTILAKKLKKEEDFVKASLERLKPILNATIIMITKKFTMTYEEIAQELRDEEKEQEMVEKSDEEDFNEEEDDTKLKQQGIIDPSTGRIIPKWMYRLHGLNQEFKCEICGDQSYFGRRAFDRHFKDFRHSNGMRALGIPNTSHFLDITKIEDAKKLYATLKKDLEKSEFNRGAEEEFEDSQGNVMNRAEYEDLKREGLL